MPALTSLPRPNTSKRMSKLEDWFRSSGFHDAASLYTIDRSNVSASTGFVHVVQSFNGGAYGDRGATATGTYYWSHCYAVVNGMASLPATATLVVGPVSPPVTQPDVPPPATQPTTQPTPYPIPVVPTYPVMPPPPQASCYRETWVRRIISGRLSMSYNSGVNAPRRSYAIRPDITRLAALSSSRLNRGG